MTPNSASGPSAPPPQLPSLNNTEAMKGEDREGSAAARPVAAAVEEPAARKMEVDENYDDDEPEVKEKVSARSSPRQVGEAAAAAA